MRRELDLKLMVRLLALIVFVFPLGCSKERSANPEVKDFIIYAGGSYFTDTTNTTLFNVIYAIDPGSLAPRDSIILEWPSSHMGSSADGKVLFIGVSGGTTALTILEALDASTHEILWTFSPALFGTVLSGGRRLLVRTGPTWSTGLIDAVNGSLIRMFPDSLKFVSGKSLGPEAICWVRTDATQLLTVMNVESGETHGGYHPRVQGGNTLDVQFALLHQDGRRVLCITASWFLVGDLDTDSTLFAYRINHSAGEIAISRDGNIAAVTDPSNGPHSTKRNLSVIDLRELTVLKRLVEPEIAFSSQIRFLDDKQELVAYSFPSAPAVLEIIDLTSLSVTKSVWLPEGDSVYSEGVWISGAFDVAPAPY